MHKLVFKLCLCLFLLGFGCAHAPQTSARSQTQEITKAYLSKINKADGISLEEAVLLAQSHLIFMGQGKNYKLDMPYMERTTQSSWDFRFIPVQKTLGDVLHKPEMVVTINKKTGEANTHKDYQKKL